MRNKFAPLRLRRLRFRVKRVELADRLGCSPGWISRLERDPYSGPAGAKWEGLYREALESILEERKAQQ